MVRSRSEYYTSMSVSGLPTFLILVKNMNLLSSSIYKHLKTYLIKHKQSLIKLKAEFNAIGSGNWEGINFNRRSFQISMFYRTFSPIYILKSSVLLHFCRSGPTVFGKSNYPALVLFEQPNCIDWINICYILLLTEESDFLKFVFQHPGIFCWTL